VGRNSSVGKGTDYGLDGQGIETGGGDLGAHPHSCKMGTGSFREVKRPGRGVDHPPPYSAEVKERGKLYLYSTSGPSWPVIG